MSNHSKKYLEEVSLIATKIEPEDIESMVEQLAEVRSRRGRVFFLGAGGSAGNAGHAVNDFRKLCGIEAYSVTDNVSELTARVNDEGWDSSFVEWLKVSHLGSSDAIFVLSVGGGNVESNVSVPIVNAIKLANEVGAKVFGIVGRDGGYTKMVGDYVVVSPTISEVRVTPHAEEFQGVIWHCLVSHPKLQLNSTKW
jgi:D-sedoheptulose 7-phosphate isomerase